MLVEILTKFYGVDIIAMFLTFAGLYFIGSKKSCGFIIASLGNLTWIILGLFVESSGLIFANAVIIVLYIRGYVKWKKETKLS